MLARQQCDWRLELHARRVARTRGRRWRDRQRRLRRGARRDARAGQLLREQTRRGRPAPDGGPRVRAEDVRINAVAPGPTETDIQPQDEDERAEWLLDLLPDGATQGKGVSGRVLNWFSGGLLDKHSRTPMERHAHPAGIASAIAFLASSEMSFVTGQVLPVDGGQTAD